MPPGDPTPPTPTPSPTTPSPAPIPPSAPIAPPPPAYSTTASATTVPTIRWPYLLPRTVLLLFLAYSDTHTLLDPETWNIFAGLTLAVHEGGHLLFGPFGEWLMIAGGSLTQILAPVIAASLLWRQGDRYGVAIVGTWIAYSLTNLAAYIGDARAMQLQLVGFSDDPLHDWHYLLNSVHLLPYDTRLALLTQDVAWLVLLASVAMAARVLTRDARGRIDPAGGFPADATPSA